MPSRGATEARASTSMERVEELDVALASLCRSAGAVRLSMGVALERLAALGGHHEMGFPSIEAYALERCERSARWVQEARFLARRLQRLPRLRRAVISGEATWSMVRLLVNVATADSELAWMMEARGRTVRQMRKVIAAWRAGAGDDGSQGDALRGATRRRKSAEDSGSVAADRSGSAVAGCTAEDGARCQLTVTVDCTDAWLFESVRMIVGRVSGERSVDSVMEAMLAEGFSSLAGRIPRGQEHGVEAFGDRALDAARRAWQDERRRRRDEAEALCEGRLRAAPIGLTASVSGPGFDDASEVDDTPEGLDAELRRLSGEMARRDLAIGRLAEAFWQQAGWRQLGYATGAQYARERLGLHVSSVEAKRRLARRLASLPHIAAALEQGVIGYEAARLLVRVATARNEQVLVQRASERTVRHLREEVDAMEMLGRMKGTPEEMPPSEDVMRVLAAIEAEVVSGRAFASASGGTAEPESSGPQRTETSAGQDGSGAESVDRMSAEMSARALAVFDRALSCTRHGRGIGAKGRVTLRLWLRPETREYYRWVERIHERYGHGASFFRYLCETFISTWASSLDTREAYAGVYARDGYRCRNPVCSRRDVTPHHLRFRSRGGDDSPENVAALCTWCHLEGVHLGRLRASPPASAIRWSIGRIAHTIVEGRRRTVAR